MPDTRTEYLVRNGHGVWEICRPGVFVNPERDTNPDIKFIVAWADRRGAWADLRSGPVSVNLEVNKIRISFWNEPEGDDRLDGQHPHWTTPHEHLWMFAVPRVREILEGNLQ